MPKSIGRKLAAETLGTLVLLAAVVGSGIMGDRLSGGNIALALLANTISTGAVLVVLILSLAPISGAHFNPAVTLAEALRGRCPWREVPGYLAAQMCGATMGVLLAHVMFDEAVFSVSAQARGGLGQITSELIATMGLVGVIIACEERGVSAVAAAVGLYITSAYWFTASTSFANPAVTIARSLTDSFAGIRPTDVPGFVAAQLVGSLAAVVLLGWLRSPGSSEAVGALGEKT